MTIMSGLAIGTVTGIAGGFVARQGVHSLELLRGDRLRIVRHLPFGMLAEPKEFPISDVDIIDMADDRFVCFKVRGLGHNLIAMDQLPASGKKSDGQRALEKIGFINTDRAAFRELLKGRGERAWDAHVRTMDTVRASSPTPADAAVQGGGAAIDPYAARREAERQAAAMAMGNCGLVDPTAGYDDEGRFVGGVDALGRQIVDTSLRAAAEPGADDRKGVAVNSAGKADGESLADRMLRVAPAASRRGRRAQRAR
jgi:hypothetical protein